MSSVLRTDAEILPHVMREAVRTSPGSFLKTVADVDAEPPDYWVTEIRSSTWVVAQYDGEVIGVAASKRPNPLVDPEDPATVRYIESVWVAPGQRGKRLGERLIKYLLAAEYWRNEHVKQFVLWVYTTNDPAMGLYEHIGFVKTGEGNVVKTKEGNVGTRTEVKYSLDFDPEVHTTIGLATNGIKQHDHFHCKVTYRLLGQPEST
jgi:ribosomal protein S18 acetylase RimI-like enzyme